MIFYTNLVSFDKIPFFFPIFGEKKILVNIRCSDVIKIQNQLKLLVKELHLRKSLIFKKFKLGAKQGSYWFSSHLHHFLKFYVGGLFPQEK